MYQLVLPLLILKLGVAVKLFLVLLFTFTAQHNAELENGGIDIVALAKARKFSSHFHSLIDRCLEKNPKCRYESGNLPDVCYFMVNVGHVTV